MWVNLSEAEMKMIDDGLFLRADQVKGLLGGFQKRADTLSLQARLQKRVAQQKDPDAILQRKAYADAVRTRYGLSDGDLDLDDDVIISSSDEGAYVLGWLWVTHEEAGQGNPTLDEAGDTFRGNPTKETAAAYMQALLQYESDGMMICDDKFRDGLTEIHDFLSIPA